MKYAALFMMLFICSVSFAQDFIITYEDETTIDNRTTGEKIQEKLFNVILLIALLLGIIIPLIVLIKR